MIYYLKLTDEASGLLLSIARWYVDTSQSLEVAVKWHDGFINKLEMLEHDPFRGNLAPENDRFAFELRELHYGSGSRLTHRALYWLVGPRIEVLSIRHLAQRPIEPGDLRIDEKGNAAQFANLAATPFLDPPD